MQKGKIFLIIGIVILALGIPIGIFLLKQKVVFKLGAQNPNRPENVQVTGITEEQATINWTTKNPIQSLISYGLSPANLSLLQPEAAPAINHQVRLVRLLPGSNYYFVIKAEEKTFDNNGQPYVFTTLSKATPTPSPSVSPSVITEEELEKAMGTNNPNYDLNKDGVVSTLDLLLFRQQSQ